MAANLKICLLITQDDKLLLIKEKTGNNKTYKWNIVKGTVEDEDIFKAALREAVEEVNVKVKLMGSLGVHVKFYGENKYTVYFAFNAEISEGDPKVSNVDQQADGEDIVEVRWFTIDELKQLKEEDFVIDISHLLVDKFINKKIFPLGVITSKDFTSD